MKRYYEFTLRVGRKLIVIASMGRTMVQAIRNIGIHNVDKFKAQMVGCKTLAFKVM
jgi:hypothetical protein